MNNFIVGFGSKANEYRINGVRYVVESRYAPFDLHNAKNNIQINSRLENYLTSDFTDLPPLQAADKMKAEYVCSGCVASEDAWKEDKHAVQK